MKNCLKSNSYVFFALLLSTGASSTNSEATHAVQAPEVRDRLAAEDMDAASGTAAQMDAARRGELDKWTRIVKQLKLQFE